MIRADANWSGADKALSMVATVVDLPEPVAPTIAVWRVNSLSASKSAGIASALAR